MPEQDFSEIAKLSERYNKDPKSRIFVQLADAYRKNSMIDEALAVLEQGLAYHPQYPLAYLILGKCFFDKRMYAQSREALEKTIAFDPMNIVALRMLAQIGETTKDDNCQLSAYKGIVMVDPTDTTAKEKLAALEARQRKGPVYTLTLAEEYEKQGNLSEALKVYEHLGFTDPSDILIQQRIKAIKSKLSGEEKKEEEQKLKELNLEKYFEPEQLSKESKAPAEPPKTESSMFVESIHETMAEDVAPKKPSEPSLAESLLVDVQKPATPAEPPKDEVLPLQDFLVEAETKAEPAVEKKPAKPPEKEGVALFSEPPIFKQPSAPAETVKEPTTAEEKVEILSVDEFLHGTGKTEPPAPEPIIEPEPPAAVKKPAVEAKEEVMSMEDLLVESAPSEAPTPEPIPAVEEPPVPQPTPVEIVEPISAEPPVVKTAEPVPPLPEEKPAPGPEPEKTEETQKPKEEDFKSFQDWLSSLLK